MHKTLQMNTKLFNQAFVVNLQHSHIRQDGEVSYYRPSTLRVNKNHSPKIDSVKTNATISQTANSLIFSISQKARWQRPNSVAPRGISLNGMCIKRGPTERTHQTTTNRLSHLSPKGRQIFSPNSVITTKTSSSLGNLRPNTPLKLPRDIFISTTPPIGLNATNTSISNAGQPYTLAASPRQYFSYGIPSLGIHSPNPSLERPSSSMLSSSVASAKSLPFFKCTGSNISHKSAQIPSRAGPSSSLGTSLSSIDSAKSSPFLRCTGSISVASAKSLPFLASTGSNISQKRLYSSSRLKLISKEQAVSHIQPNTTVFVEGVVGTPKVLMNEMYDHVKRNGIQGVTLLDVFSLYPYENMTLEDDCVRRVSFFVSPYTRKFVNKGRAEYVPLMLNDLPMLFDRGYFTPDVALISTSPPDDRGFLSLGTNVTELLSVISASKLVIAQINDRMPRSLGDAIIHVDQIDYGVEVSYELFSPASEPVTDVDRTIANLICNELIEDEATLQIGLGKIPEAILSNIKHHRNLGVSTELFTSGMIGLIEQGVITNSKKSIDRDIITATLLLGDKALYEFVHENDRVQMKPCSYSNDPAIIRQNHRMTAINTCLEIDITGQVVSDSLGASIYSGFGGQVDFMRGAMTGLDGRGKAILALASTDEKSGSSKIVSTLKPGAGVVCSRAHVNYIVTEFGAVDLCGKSTVQRAHALIGLAHPDHREKLEREAFELLGVMPRA